MLKKHSLFNKFYNLFLLLKFIQVFLSNLYQIITKILLTKINLLFLIYWFLLWKTERIIVSKINYTFINIYFYKVKKAELS